MTHPLHPLSGREFTLVTYRHTWREQRVYFHDDHGQLTSIPTAWTSLMPLDPVVVLGAGRSAFRLQDLLELADFIAKLKQESKP